MNSHHLDDSVTVVLCLCITLLPTDVSPSLVKHCCYTLSIVMFVARAFQFKCTECAIIIIIIIIIIIVVVVLSSYVSFCDRIVWCSCKLSSPPTPHPPARHPPARHPHFQLNCQTLITRAPLATRMTPHESECAFLSSFFSLLFSPSNKLKFVYLIVTY